MHPNLTPRMEEILPFVCRGYTNAEIGERVFASEETVKSYVKRLLDYFQARNRTHLAALAVESGYVRGVGR
jgi:DNA-binding NarL/FixJ family response regulator